MFMYWIKLSYGWLVYDSDITIAVTGIITVTSCIINNKFSVLTLYKLHSIITFEIITVFVIKKYDESTTRRKVDRSS